MVRLTGVHKVKKNLSQINAYDRATARALLPLVALGGGLAVTPAAALELGELTVQSNLGQPLRASIAYALAPNEMLSDVCVAVGGGRSTSGLPGIGRSSVSITDRAILITGQTAVREPMLATRVTINCPYTPNLSREYMLFVDPVAASEPQTAISTPVAAPATPAVSEPVARTSVQVARTTPVDNTPIGQSARYQVKVGETLGEIVARVENRSMSLWPAVNLVFVTNPDAFIDNDPNKLKAGSWLTIPSFDGSAPVVAAAAVEEATAAVAPLDAAIYEPPILEEVADTVVEDTAPVEEVAPVDLSSELRPNEAVIESNNPYVEPASVEPVSSQPASTIVIPDTQLEGPTTSADSPNVPTAVISTGSRSESTTTIAWLIGGGLALIALLLLFGRRVRNRFGSTPVGTAAVASAQFEQDDTDYELEDDSPTEENLALDADLVLGTGLSEGTDMDVAQDFGFAATTDLDIELPAEPEATDSETDVIAAIPAKMESILESEVLPEDDDYDMSVIMDVTKMPEPEDVTERDLKAVEVKPADESLITDSYTISQGADYDILEQDYEEEMSATQALNLEIERAAADLKQDLDETVSEEATEEMPLATVTEIDVTAQLPVQAEDEDDTIEAVRQPNPNDTAAVTVNMSGDEKTAEMPVANDDETAEMEISGGKSG